MRRPALPRLGALLLAGTLPLGGAIAADPAPATNPLFAGADPGVLVDRGTVRLLPTGDGDSLRGWKRTDGQWRAGPPLIALRDIAWVDDGAPRHFLWAPDMLAADGRYYLYYSIGPQNPTPSRIGVATAMRPDGPFTDSGRPLLTGGDGFEAIDPAIFADPRDGRVYLLAGGSAGARLRMFQLGADRVTIARELPIAQPPHFTEGAYVHVRDGVYYLSYSHGRWNRGDYSVHYATAPGMSGPWTYRGRLLASDARYKGPGHHSFFRDPADGAWKIAYHRWQSVSGDGPYRGQRQVAIETIRYLPDGAIAPIVMTP